MEYTIKTLAELNPRKEHLIDQKVVNKINKIIKRCEENTKKHALQTGDVIRYTSPYGKYYSDAHIEQKEKDRVYMCESGNSHVGINKYDNDIYFSTSGGAWEYIEIKKLKPLALIKEKEVWTWGNQGAMANGSLHFTIPVNIWECDLNEYGFSTKNYTKKIFTFVYNNKNDSYNWIMHSHFSIENLAEYLQKKNAKISKLKDSKTPKNVLVVWIPKEGIEGIEEKNKEYYEKIIDEIEKREEK